MARFWPVKDGDPWMWLDHYKVGDVVVTENNLLMCCEGSYMNAITSAQEIPFYDLCEALSGAPQANVVVNNDIDLSSLEVSLNTIAQHTASSNTGDLYSIAQELSNIVGLMRERENLRHKQVDAVESFSLFGA